MALTDTKVRNAKFEAKDYKLADERGLFLLITARGTKLWRLKYRLNGKERKISLGRYPEVSLKEARARADEARRLISEGSDPVAERRSDRLKAIFNADNCFDVVAEEYIEKLQKEGKAPATIDKARWMKGLLSDKLGRRPVADIEPIELLAVLRKLCDEGKLETASRVRAFASRVFRYAASTARASMDPAQILRGALPSPQVRHHPAITTAEEFSRLLKAIDDYSGSPVTKYALQLSAHLFQRPGEIRQMEWSEINFEQRIWSIPSSKMKKRVEHKVPLSTQAVAVLKNVQALTGGSRYVFPSPRSWKRPMSENAVTGALRRMGFTGEEMTAHGFRTSASSMLNESGRWNPDAIERALAHKDRDQMRGTYNRGDYRDERMQMAQWWSDQIDLMRDGAEIIDIGTARKDLGN